MSYKNTNQPNGRPNKQARNKKIIADRMAGMEFEDIAKKYDLELAYARKIAADYTRSQVQKNKHNEAQEKIRNSLYGERDAQLMALYNTLNARGSLSKFHIQQM